MYCQGQDAEANGPERVQAGALRDYSNHVWHFLMSSSITKLAESKIAVLITVPNRQRTLSL